MRTQQSNDCASACVLKPCISADLCQIARSSCNLIAPLAQTFFSNCTLSLLVRSKADVLLSAGDPCLGGLG